MAAKFNFRSFVVLFTFIVCAIFFTVAVYPASDTYYHLSIGKEVYETHKIPTHDFRVYGSEKTDFNSTEWLAGLISYLFVNAFGSNGIVILRLILGTATLYILYRTLKLVSYNFWLNLSSVALSAYMLSYRLFDRPENFSFVFLALVNYICLFFLTKGKISPFSYLLPAVFLLWPNIHGYVPVGFALLLAYQLIFLLKNRLKVRSGKVFLALTIASGALLALQYKRVIPFILGVSGVYKFGIGEFETLPQRLWLSEGYDFFNQISLDMYLYFLVLGTFVVLFARSLVSKDKNLNDTLLGLIIAAFLMSPFKMIRIISPMVLIALPFVAQFLQKFLSSKWDVLYKTVFAFLIFILLLSILSGHIVGYRERQSITYASTNTDSMVKPRSISNLYWKPIFPEGADIFIKNHLEARRLFTDSYWGNYLIWYLPNIQVFNDAMLSFVSDQERIGERNLRNGQGDWQGLLAKYQIDTVVNSQPFTYVTNSTPVWQLPDWELVYVNDNYVIYAKKQIVKSLPYDLSKIHLELHSSAQKFDAKDSEEAAKQLKNLLAFDPKNGFARQQLILYYMEKDLTKANQIAVESLSLLPKDPLISLYLGTIYAKQKNCARSRDFAQEAVTKSYNQLLIKIEAEKIKCP